MLPLRSIRFDSYRLANNISAIFDKTANKVGKKKTTQETSMLVDNVSTVHQIL